MMKMPPRYIVLEGLDGSGKSTQLAWLQEALLRAQIPFTTTQEPGGTPVGQEIRHVLLSGASDKMDAITEALLYSAARHENARQVILPALAKGTWVLSSRNFLSTYAIQGGGRGLPMETLQTLTHIAIEDTIPHLTTILDLPAEESLRRKHSQTNTPDRFERESIAFHERIRQAYLTYAGQTPQTTVVINAEASMEEVHKAILTTLNTIFGLTLTAA